MCRMDILSIYVCIKQHLRDDFFKVMCLVEVKLGLRFLFLANKSRVILQKPQVFFFLYSRILTLVVKGKKEEERLPSMQRLFLTE